MMYSVYKLNKQGDNITKMTLFHSKKAFLSFFFQVASFLKIIYIFMAALGLSLVAESMGVGLLSSSSVPASHCSGFSCWGTRALGHTNFSNC